MKIFERSSEMTNPKSFLSIRWLSTPRNGLAILAVALLAGCGKPKAQHNPPPSIGLHEAVIQGNMAAVHGHIAAGSDIDQPDPSGGSSPLITAATFGRTEAAKALIEAGAAVNFKNKDGSTPLHAAAFFCRAEIVKVLLDHGADKESRNNAGATPLDSVAGPFHEVKPIYELIAHALKPLGLQLDYERIKALRPEIAAMLR